VTHLSRRQLAEYAANALLDGVSSKKISAQLAAVLKETKRTNESGLLMQDIARELEIRGKVANATITSATPLSDSLREELAGFIKNAANVDKVTLQENTDKTVIGGIKIETAIHAWDKTVAKKLRNIRETVK
jgi:F-type H+-transporting ATPase subunit delta